MIVSKVFKFVEKTLRDGHKIIAITFSLYEIEDEDGVAFKAIMVGRNGVNPFYIIYDQDGHFISYGVKKNNSLTAISVDELDEKQVETKDYLTFFENK